MDNEGKKPEAHFYDGIEEHDHPVPIWFSVLFFGTILFGMGYYGYYELGTGTSLRQRYEQDVAERDLRKYLDRDRNPAPSEDQLLAVAKDPGKRKLAEGVFAARCASCHGAHAQGVIGPNLTDAYWLHGNKLAEIRNTIAKGVLDKGMPPWEAVLSFDELNAMPAYIRSLKDSHPAGAKEPQGVLVKGD
jgi:cytochrome c oxidase cbb3-type subunit 3